MEKYKFSYGNKTNFFKVKFVKFCCVISCMFFYFWIWARMLGYADYLFRGNDIALKVTMGSIILSYGFLLIYLLIEALAPQMVYVYSEHIKIKRYGFNIRYIFNGFTDKIYLYDIVSCEKYYGARDEHFLYKKTNLYFDWDDLVEIRYGKLGVKDKYIYIPIKNADEFVYQVNCLLKSSSIKTGETQE